MGMAAGQARLLSITSRISDNELRAQIINNNKMRLATKSSQVSEAYVQALNEAQYMFTNYDANNNTNYQALTFNALTSYNPYNNQYALVNSSNNILVSERDAENFKAANGDMEKFLKNYGLEKTTTYFNNMKDKNGNVIPFNSNEEVYFASIDEDGNIQYNQSTGMTPAQLKALYEGTLKDNPDIFGPAGSGNKLNSYMGTLSTQAYYDYQKALEDYSVKENDYLGLLSEAMSAKLETLIEEQCNSITGNADISIEQLGENMKMLAETIRTKVAEFAPDDSTYYANLADRLEACSRVTVEDKYSSKDNYQLLIGSDNKYYIGLVQDGKVVDIPYAIKNIGTNESGSWQLFEYYDKENDEDDIEDVKTGFTLQVTRPSTGNNSEDTTWSGIAGFNPALPGTKGNTVELADDLKYLGEDGNSLTFAIANGGPESWDFSVTYPNDKETMLSMSNSIIDELRQSIYTEWDISKFEKNFSLDSLGDEGIKAKIENAKKEYHTAAQALGEIIFGTDYDINNDKCPPLECLDDITKLYNDYANLFTQDGKDSQGQSYNFFDIYKNILLDNVMATYGEPYTTWIDTSAPTGSYNENGEAKYNWYSNLFERMSQGYSVLLDGLASSTEWIKFAFESGMVVMEQVDSYQNWNKLNYTNCSDITQQTDTAAVAKAEAEYNAAMNKIENKDKRYDLELKNIDTEHNSLQTEYDSIKGAIDKNIERTFKMYG